MKIKKYQPYLIILIICIVAGIGIILIKSYSPKSNQNSLAKRNFTKVLDPILVTISPKAFRLDRSLTELFIITEDQFSILSAISTSTKSHSIQSNEAWNIFQIQDSIIMYGEKNNCFYLLNGTTLDKIISIDSSDDNVLLINNHLFYGNELSNFKTPYLIRDKRNSDFICNVNQLLYPFLKNIDSMCALNYMEGVLLDYDKLNFIFLPYRLSQFFIINKKDAKAKSIKTIDVRERVELNSIETKMPNGGSMFTCESINGSDILQNAATTSIKYLFILTTSIIDNSKYNAQIVDVYSKSEFKYLFSIKIKLSDKKRLILDLEYVDHSLYFLDSEAEIKKASFIE